MLPDMSDVFNDGDDWLSPYTLKTVTTTTVDFVETEVITGDTVQAMIQVADKTKLNSEAIDWALTYLMVHSPDGLSVGEFIEYEGADYKLIEVNPYGNYGYYEAVAEQTKRPLLVVNA